MSAFHHTVRVATPFHDRSRSRRLVKIALWLLGIAVVLAICHVAGFGVLDWFESVWDTMKEISIQYIVAGVFFQTIQTTLTALAWYFILAAGYPDGGVRYRDILAAYAVGVAMNGFLPANIGTFASLLMYMALIRGATFPGILGAMTVQKIFYTAIGVFVYLYLFISVPGTFDLQLGVVDNHRLLDPTPHRRRGRCDLSPHPSSSGTGSRASGRRRSRGERSCPAPATTSSRFCCRRSARGSQS